MLNEELCSRWILDIVISLDQKVRELIYNFVSREKIIEINKQYLKHDYPTDIITFDYSEAHLISGEVYICSDVVQDNAAQFKIAYQRELNRVMIHGVLHLLGMKDGTDEEKFAMRMKEDECLKVLASYEN